MFQILAGVECRSEGCTLVQVLATYIWYLLHALVHVDFGVLESGLSWRLSESYE